MYIYSLLKINLMVRHTLLLYQPPAFLLRKSQRNDDTHSEMLRVVPPNKSHFRLMYKFQHLAEQEHKALPEL